MDQADQQAGRDGSGRGEATGTAKAGAGACMGLALLMRGCFVCMLSVVCRVAARALLPIHATRSMTALSVWQPPHNRSRSMSCLALCARVAVVLCAVSALAVAQSAPPPPPPPPPQAAPPPCRSAVRGAARGAAGGAMFGAIAGDAGKGAAIGAAVGGVGRAARNGSARASGQCY